ncbi:MAG: Crp/Fnr family transcriptional regulator [Limisphaerales bacterium]
MWESIRRLPLVAGLSTAGVQLLGQHVRESVIPAGHMVVREGDPGRHLFFIDRGLVRIFKEGRGKERELARLGEGGFFGEMGILIRDGRSASVQAMAETKLLVMGYVAFEILADHQPLDYARLLENLARELVKRLRELDDRFTTIT